MTKKGNKLDGYVLSLMIFKTTEVFIFPQKLKIVI